MRRVLDSGWQHWSSPAPRSGRAVATAASSPVVGHVYVNDNTAGHNTIAVFDRHATAR